MIILLTDGRQTAGGTDATAIYRAKQAKEDGILVATLSFGNVDQSVSFGAESRYLRLHLAHYPRPP